MRHLYNFRLAFALLSLVVTSAACAIDMGGPYKNGQTAIEFTEWENGVWLYGVNSLEYHRLQVGGQIRSLYNRIDYPDSVWEIEELRDDGNFVINTEGRPLQYLARNDAHYDDQTYVMTLGITQNNSDLQAIHLTSELAPSFGSRWWSGGQGDEMITRMVSGRIYPKNQWATKSRLNGLPFAVLKTSDGWETSIDISGGQHLADMAIYSVAIDDEPTVNRAIIATVPRADYADVMDGDVDPLLVGRRNGTLLELS